ncbi:MAG: F0F1 ATP synthase subunit A [Campylobacteraceae bacterium]|jgi:F-type H+-transporting ATPase subunit a|nr:F0F1 ATP synthase subunit A [Campylobacteraceae bacterium]
MGDRLFTFFGAFLGHSQAAILVSHTLLTVLVVLLVAVVATQGMKLVPRGLQNVMETYLEGVINMGAGVFGEERARRYLPLIATIGLVVFVSNMMGIIPGFESPTSNINMTLALALVVFVYYNFEGIRHQGFVHYFAHFMGPVKILAPLMFPIEIISHISRIISLSFRLMGNVKGDDMFLAVLLMLVPWIVPLPAFFLLFFFGILQTFIFMILTYVYLAGAVMMEEENKH